jgi:hypothetical protein
MFRIGLLFLATLVLLGLVPFTGCGYSSHSMGRSGSPSIASLSPNMANANDPTFMLTVTGSGFGTDTVVYWNGTALPSMYGTATTVTATVSAMDVLNAGMFPVYVRSGGNNSNMLNFTVQ